MCDRYRYQEKKQNKKSLKTNFQKFNSFWFFFTFIRKPTAKLSSQFGCLCNDIVLQQQRETNSNNIRKNNYGIMTHSVSSGTCLPKFWIHHFQFHHLPVISCFSSFHHLIIYKVAKFHHFIISSSTRSQYFIISSSLFIISSFHHLQGPNISSFHHFIIYKVSSFHHFIIFHHVIIFEL